MIIKYNFNLSRIYKYFGEGSFGIVSAYLGHLSKEQNEKRQEELKNKVREMGYGYKELKGVWTGEEGMQEIEYSLFIPQINPESVIYLGQGQWFENEEDRIPQQAVIYTEEPDQIVLDYLDTGKKEVKNKSEFNFKNTWEGWSEYKGKPFRYSSVEYDLFIPPEPRGWIAGMSLGEFKEAKQCDNYYKGKQLSPRDKEVENAG